MSNTGVTLSYFELFVLAIAPAIIGGLIGLGGGFLGPWLLEGRKQEVEKRKRRAEKFEELIASIHEHHHWVGTAGNVRIFGHKTDLGVDPITKALAIVAIYFPQFHQDMAELDLRSGEYQQWQFEAGQRRLDGETNYRKGHIEAYEPYTRKRSEVLSSLRRFANEEFK